MCLLSRCTFRYQRCTLDQNLTIFKCFVMRFVLFARAYFATFEDAETPRHGYSTPLCYSVGRRHVTIVIDLYCTWPIQPTNCVCEAPPFRTDSRATKKHSFDRDIGRGLAFVHYPGQQNPWNTITVFIHQWCMLLSSGCSDRRRI